MQSHETVAWSGINVVPRGASSIPAKQGHFQHRLQFVFPEGVGRWHLLLAGGEVTVGMMAHHAAWGENSFQSGHPLLLNISPSVVYEFIFNFLSFLLFLLLLFP